MVDSLKKYHLLSLRKSGDISIRRNGEVRGVRVGNRMERKFII